MEMTDKDRYERIREGMGPVLRHRRTCSRRGKTKRCVWIGEYCATREGQNGR